jgi:acyl-CoA thioesterase YciA
MNEPYVAIQVVMMPADTNPHGTIFGGVILSYIDMAGAIGARRSIQLAGGNAEIAYMTVAVNRVEFKHPVLVGDVVRFVAAVKKVGRTSITMHINVEADRGAQTIQVTEAEIVYVGVEIVNGVRQPVVLLPTTKPN